VHPPGHEVHPLARARVNFRTFLLGGLDLDIYLDRLSMVTAKKVVNFFDQNVHPQTISWLRLWVQTRRYLTDSTHTN